MKASHSGQMCKTTVKGKWINSGQQGQLSQFLPEMLELKRQAPCLDTIRRSKNRMTSRGSEKLLQIKGLYAQCKSRLRKHNEMEWGLNHKTWKKWEGDCCFEELMTFWKSKYGMRRSFSLGYLVRFRKTKKTSISQNFVFYLRLSKRLK